MKVIPREARRITYSTEIRNLKKELTLNDFQGSMVIGTVLGDGYLEPNWSKTNYRLKIQHSVQQKDYLFWKYEMLKDWVLTEPKPQSVNNSYRFRTISHKELTDLRKQFYKDGKKIVPENLVERLNLLALAVWFMDDGDVLKWQGKTMGYHINTQSFGEDDNKLLVNTLKVKFDLDASIQNNNGYKRLYIGAKSRDAFKKMISPYVLPSMQYKLG